MTPTRDGTTTGTPRAFSRSPAGRQVSAPTSGLWISTNTGAVGMAVRVELRRQWPATSHFQRPRWPGVRKDWLHITSTLLRRRTEAKRRFSGRCALYSGPQHRLWFRDYGRPPTLI